MEATFDRQALLGAVSRALQAVPRRASPTPILNHIKLQVANNAAWVIGTDLELRVTEMLDAEGQMSTCVPARDFKRALSSIDQETVYLEMNQGLLYLRWAKGKRGVMTFPTMPGYDFPESPDMSKEVPSATIYREDLSRVIRAISICASEESFRPNMRRVRIEPGVLVATDGHRLSVADAESIGIAATILPRALEVILGGEEDIELEDHSEWTVLTSGRLQVASRRTDMAYPDWRRVVPEPGPWKLPINRAELLAVIKRASASADGTYRLYFSLDEEESYIQAADYDKGKKFSEVIPGSYSGEPLVILVDGKMFGEVLEAFPADDIELTFVGEKQPVTIQGPNIMSLVMPQYQQ